MGLYSHNERVKKSLWFFVLWAAGSVAAVSIAFVGVALVDGDFVDPASAQQASAGPSFDPLQTPTSEAEARTLDGSDQDAPSPESERLNESGAVDSEGQSDSRTGPIPQAVSVDGSVTPAPTPPSPSPPSSSATNADSTEPSPAITESATSVTPAQVAELPTSTAVPAAASTPVPPPPPTSTAVPAAASTPVPPPPPTSTAVPAATGTPVPPPPTSTAVPPPPTSTAVPPPPTSTPVPPPAQVLTFYLVGGSTSISFSADGVTVLWATPNPGFEVEIEPEDDKARVDFESDGHESRIDAWWSDGPRHEIREDSDDD